MEVVAMPAYDLRCLSCGNEFTRRLSVSERKEAVCEKCGSKKLEQLFRRCNILGSKGGISPEPAGAGPSCGGSCSGCAGCS
ncbi:MAG: zinc ribbon domain-containing protein [Peptococcaceae bacterium]|nr:zinc ribbon domain-containing protein [Peptococcaceae bacterium]MDH7524722.1 zinc ribbon domain-containing protein [Peptococcaceae bacterium]